MSADAKLAIGELADADIDAVVALWARCDLTRPWNDPRADIALARRGPGSAILAGKRDGVLLATVMVGYDGHRGWFYYVAVDAAQGALEARSHDARPCHTGRWPGPRRP